MKSNKTFITKLFLLIASVLILGCSQTNAQWQPAKSPLMTKWASQVSPDKPLPEYPRPQLVRHDWQNLNGLWDYAIRPKDEPQPQNFDGKILVPFPVESALSGVMKMVGSENRLWYKKDFTIPKEWNSKSVMLHFGAVDWDTAVWVNGKQLGQHKGGYDPFSFDITEALNKNVTQQIILSVWDPSDAGYQPRGKQVSEPKGIWYTPTTGIWQTVWLEPVSQTYIKSIRITPDIDAGLVRIKTNLSNSKNIKVHAHASAVNFSTGFVSAEPGTEIILPITNPKLWSPDSPFLYDLLIKVTDNTGQNEYDAVKSYFGMRKISLGKDKNGFNRICLNNEPLFQYGPLDQGFWPDGLYTAPTDEALRYDIEVTKMLGCNMARKHVKVEPARWYYWCDKLGLLVWQDMVSGDETVKRNRSDSERSPESASQYELELERMIDAFYNYPSIIMWVTFNEGWGQFDTVRIAELAQSLDPTRLINSASGWVDRGAGHIQDNHVYPTPEPVPVEMFRASVLGEYGGLGLPVSGHTWQDEKNWGYKSFTNSDELTDAYLKLIDKLEELEKQGLSAAVYVQTTDVEIEVNGLMTYDRQVIKMDIPKIKAAHDRLTAFKP